MPKCYWHSRWVMPTMIIRNAWLKKFVFLWFEGSWGFTIDVSFSWETNWRSGKPSLTCFGFFSDLPFGFWFGFSFMRKKVCLLTVCVLRRLSCTRISRLSRRRYRCPKHQLPHNPKRICFHTVGERRGFANHTEELTNHRDACVRVYLRSPAGLSVFSSLLRNNEKIQAIQICRLTCPPGMWQHRERCPQLSCVPCLLLHRDMEENCMESHNTSIERTDVRQCSDVKGRGPVWPSHQNSSPSELHNFKTYQHSQNVLLYYELSCLTTSQSKIEKKMCFGIPSRSHSHQELQYTFGDDASHTIKKQATKKLYSSAAWPPTMDSIDTSNKRLCTSPMYWKSLYFHSKLPSNRSKQFWVSWCCFLLIELRKPLPMQLVEFRIFHSNFWNLSHHRSRTSMHWPKQDSRKFSNHNFGMGMRILPATNMPECRVLASSLSDAHTRGFFTDDSNAAESTISISQTIFK